MPKARTPVLAVYGATSYTATNHLLPYLATHPDAPAFHLILAGRNADKLYALDAALPPSAGPGPREVLPLKLNDQGGVESMCARADVVLNLAGPYQLHNAEALISACIKHSTHYVDLCGEPNFLARLMNTSDFAASKSGSVIIPMCGFEAAPGDLSIYHGLRTLQAHAGREATIAAATNFYDIDGGVSGGTLASIAASADSGDAVGGEWCLVPQSWSRDHSSMSALQLVLRPPVDVAGAPAVGGWFPGSVLNVTTIRRSWFLSRLSPVVLNGDPATMEAEAQKEPRHGEDVVFAEAMTRMSFLRVTSSLTAVLSGVFLLVLLGLYTSAAWVRDAAAKWIPQPGEGPTMEECKRGHTRLTTVARSADNRFGVITRYAAPGDPGYSHTGKILAEAGLSLLLPPPEGTALPPLARTGGLLTPSTGLGMVVIERMRLNGVASVESEIVELGRPGERKKLL